jgi:pSer/pThr/pTyr-binding forkhead associated (FHA) protein/ribosomal protein L40E
MVTCPACGKENEDSAYECKRCRAPLREEEPQDDFEVSTESLGELCQRCEAYNVPGVQVCSNCGAALFGEVGPQAAPDKTPPEAFTPPSQVPETISQELRALAISDEEAAEAGLTMPRNGSPGDKTPPDPFAVPVLAPSPPSTGRARVAPAATTAAAAPVAATPARRPPPAPPPSSGRSKLSEPMLPVSLPAEKPCTNCGALNPPAAKFCFDCGTPFAKKTAPATPPPPPSIQVDAELAAVTYEDATMESAPVAADEPAAAEPLAEPVPEEQPPPFAARLVLDTGSNAGAGFALAHVENSIGGSAAHIGLGEDPFVAPHAATLAFVEDRLVLRDEGSANGIYVKVRESAPLEPGDVFVAGERLLRYDGPLEMPRSMEGDPPFLGAPRPQGAAFRVTEVLAGAKTGRTCHRSGSISIGRTGCDMNFGSDALLAAKHAEVRIGEDGSAIVVDLGEAPGGVFLRVRAQQPVDLQPGDVVRVGEQQLRVELG